MIACIALAAAILFFIGARGGGFTATVCVIEINGEEFARYDLSTLTEEKIIEIDNEYGKNTLVLDRFGAYVTYSDCADGLEVKAGRIDTAGQSLICLPHRLLIRLEGGEDTDALAW